MTAEAATHQPRPAAGSPDAVRREQQKTRSATDIDRTIGRRVRERREALGLNQRDLAQRLGITGQQLVKYEVGDNRISASRLVALSRALETPLSDLLAGLGHGREPLDHHAV